MDHLRNLHNPRYHLLRFYAEIFHSHSDFFKHRLLDSTDLRKRILALNSDIIVIDEPTSQLDPEASNDVFEIIDLLKKQGKTVIIAEHKVDLLPFPFFNCHGYIFYCRYLTVRIGESNILHFNCHLISPTM